jgi:predicted acetyltransferase
MPLTLRPFVAADEGAALAAWAQFLGTGFDFLPFDFDPSTPWAAFIERLARYRDGIDLPENRVRTALLAADVDGQLVGRSSIRFELNAFLAGRGGHVGYAVIPAFRRRGFATAILSESVAIARNEGVSDVLVTCDDSNTGSWKVIERCGGVLEEVVSGDGAPFRRYWI